MSHVVLFAGHRVDVADRTVPRFLADHVEEAKRAISTATPLGTRLGVSSAANGGDILFLEVCVNRGIPVHIVLPFQPEKFFKASVATDALGDWEARFWHLWSTTPLERRQVVDLPKGANAYAACNDLLIAVAAKSGVPLVVVLWDGHEADGPGGTGDLVSKARSRCWPVTVISP